MDVAITVASPWKSAMNARFSTKSRNLWVEKMKCRTWPMFTNIVRVFSWNAARKRDEMLELYDRKLSRTVLRRESGSNSADLAGTFRPQGLQCSRQTTGLVRRLAEIGKAPWLVKNFGYNIDFLIAHLFHLQIP